MAWGNGPDSFGLVSRVLHWSTALLIVGMLALGTRIAVLEPELSNLWLYGLHKTLGMLALALVLLRLIWHRISPPPAPIGASHAWETRAAKAGHRALYALMVAIPLSGWIASSATGIDTLIAGRWVLPPIAPVSEIWEARAFAAHGVLTKVLFVLVTLHAVAALKREMDGDGTLTRMLRGKA